MVDQWRVAIVLGDATGASRSGLRRCKRDLAREMQDRTGVVVTGVPSSGHVGRLFAFLAVGEQLQSPDDSPVFAFTGDRAMAEAAARVAHEVTNQHRIPARVSVECWRPVKKRWEDASTVSERGLAEEHEYQQREDRILSAAAGVLQWRVRVELRTHRDAVALALRLSGAGHQVVRGWKSVQYGAASEDDAHRLAEETKQYVQPDVEVLAERADSRDFTDEVNFFNGTVP
jgi:hypothetical protein